MPVNFTFMKILIIDTDRERVRALKSLESGGHLVQALDTWTEARDFLKVAGFQILVAGPEQIDLPALYEWRQSLAENELPLVVLLGSPLEAQTGCVEHWLQVPLAEKDVLALPALPTAPPEPSVLNQSAALAICDNDEELFHEIADIFLDAGIQRMKNLTQAMEEKNWKNVLEVAHLLKGSALNLAAEPLGIATKYLERAGEAGNESLVLFWCAQTVYEYRRLEKYLRGLAGGFRVLPNSF